MACMTITKEHYIAAAHRLMLHPGKCRFLHGHNYKIVYHLYAKNFNPLGKEEDRRGMILDFNVVKEKILLPIENTFDHKTILQDVDPLVDILEKHGVLVQKLPSAPTAENLAGTILTLVNRECLREYNGEVQCSRVEVWETPTSMAFCEQTHMDEFTQHDHKEESDGK